MTTVQPIALDEIATHTVEMIAKKNDSKQKNRTITSFISKEWVALVGDKKKRRISHHQELQKNYAALEETINYLSCIINALERLFEPQKTGDRKRKEESQRTGDRRCKEEFQNIGDRRRDKK